MSAWTRVDALVNRRKSLSKFPKLRVDTCLVDEKRAPPRILYHVERFRSYGEKRRQRTGYSDLDGDCPLLAGKSGILRNGGQASERRRAGISIQKVG